MTKQPWRVVENRRDRIAMEADTLNAEDSAIPPAEYDPEVSTLSAIAEGLRLSVEGLSFLGPQVSKTLHRGAIAILREYLKEHI